MAAKDLEKAIANWEHDIEVYRRAKPTYVMDGDLQRMLLMQLCPPQLLMYLRLQKAEILEDYHKLKTTIHAWLKYPENLPAVKNGKLAACEQVPEQSDETEEQEAEFDETTTQALMEADESGHLLALVIN